MIDRLPFLIPYFISCAISTAVAVYAWRRNATGSRAFAIVAFTQASWTLGYILELSSDSLQTKLLWDDLQWFGTLLFPPFLLVFALQYVESEPKFVRRVRGWVLVFPVIFWLLVATNSLHGWIRANSTLIAGHPFSALTYEFTPIVYLAAIYDYANMLAALYVLAKRFFRSHPVYRTQVALIILGNLVLLVGGLLTLAGITLANQRDLTPLTFPISNLLILWAMLRFQLFDVVPIARDSVIENMPDAVIVLDEQNRVVDLNPAARALLVPTQAQVIGGPASQVFSQWPAIIGQSLGMGQTRDEIYVTVNEQKHCFEINISPLYDHNKRMRGHMVVARDVTARKQAEAALRASEERYRIVSEVIFDYAFLCTSDPDGVLRLEWITEDSFTRLTGYEGATMEAFGLYHPEDEALAQHDVKRVLQGQPTDSEYRIITKGGEVRWVYIRRYPLWDARQERVEGFYGVVQDITKRKQAEAALRASEERYRIVTELISDYAYTAGVQPDGTLMTEWITEASFTRLTGYTAEEIVESFSIYHPDDEERARRDRVKTLLGQPTEGEYRIITKNGQVRWIFMRRYPQWDAQEKRVQRYYGVAQDITERKRIEFEERAQRTLAEALLDSAEALNSTLNLEEVVDRILTNVERIAPHEAGAVLLVESGVARMARFKDGKGEAWSKDPKAFQLPIASTRNLRYVYETRQPLIIPDVQRYAGWVDVPSSRWIRSHICIPIQKDEDVIGFLTWDSATPDYFTPTMVQGLQAFAHQTAIAIINAQLYQQAQELAVLEERQRLARDLHDAVTQTMFSASVIAETLPRVWEYDREQVRHGLASLRHLTRGAVAEMRTLLLELRPEALESSDLPRLITLLVEAFSGRTGVVPSLVIEGDRVLPQEVKVAIYRIAQEALNNVSKHAVASEINVSLTLSPMVKLMVSDNGRGFDLTQVKSGSLGLKIMGERAENIGAQFSITSEPGTCTTLYVEWMG